MPKGVSSLYVSGFLYKFLHRTDIRWFLPVFLAKKMKRFFGQEDGVGRITWGYKKEDGGIYLLKKEAADMETFIVDMINRFGYLGVIFLITLENVFPPIPSEVILTFGGFMTTYTNLTVMGVVVFSTVGSVLGAYILYYVGYFLSPERLDGLLGGRLGKLLHFKVEDVRRAEEKFEKKGKRTVFLCRFIPIVRSLISIPAGMSKMDIGVFSVLTMVGSFLWNLVLVGLGAAAGANWKVILHYAENYSNFGKLILLVAAAVWFVRFMEKRKLQGENGEKRKA